MIRSLTAVIRQLSTIPDSGAGAGELGQLVSAVIAPLVPHEGIQLFGSSPAMTTRMASFGFIHGYERDFARALGTAILSGVDPYPREVLESLPVPAAVVGADPKGDKEIRRLLAGHGVECELRMLLRDNRGVWGAISLLRGTGSRAFDAGEVNLVAGLTAVLIDILRRHVTAAPLAATAPPVPAGVVIVGPDHQVRSMTPQARQWLARMSEHAPDGDWCGGLPALISLQLRGVRPQTAPFVGPAATFGRWTAARGQFLDGDEGGQIAVIIESAGSELVLPSFCQWYDISARERLVLQHTLDGSPTKLIARHLGLSAYTVSEHLQSLYRKTGVSGRGELISALAG
ncbi:helix-turn-helix transcriptional regulator [Crossiella sp. NPDC003009]